MARPSKPIGQEEFEKLCALQCTEKEICAFFDVCEDTLVAWCKRTYGKCFSDVYAIKKLRGFISLRRTQMQLAEKNATMAIFLGKNLLGQTDIRDDTRKEIASDIVREWLKSAAPTPEDMAALYVDTQGGDNVDAGA